MPIIVKPQFALVNPAHPSIVSRHIERGGRLCYKSEDKTGPGSDMAMIDRLIRMGHNSVIEHWAMSIKFIVDRGVSLELVRQRLCSFSQESTRFCTYSRNKFGNAATFIDPVFWENDPEMYGLWLNSMKEAEAAYMRMISRGATAQEARSVLPNSLKTEIMVTANMRQWRLVFSQRCANAAHPQIRQAMLPALAEVSRRYPILFKDIHEEMKPEYELFKKNNWSLAQKLDDEIDFPEEVFVALGNDNSNIA